MEANRISVHLHGGLVPWTMDGGPHAWFSPHCSGPSFLNGTGVPGQALYRYPNNQSARMVWYHDHAIGITRLNAYAGLVSAYIIRDPLEAGLISRNLIPSNEIPLVIQEKTFVTKKAVDSGYTWGGPGDLWYPPTYESMFEYGPAFGQVITDPTKQTLPEASAVPEFFGDTALVNGTPYPFAEVQRRHYRFRMLNGSQARFFNLQLYYARHDDPTEADLSKPGPRMIQIGTEGGFLPFPVALNDPPVQFGFERDADGGLIASTLRCTLLLAPAERADVIIDFSNVPAGSKLILYNDAPAPFPEGDAIVDHFTGNAEEVDEEGAPLTKPGFGPNTRTLMQFRVVPRVGLPDPVQWVFWKPSPSEARVW
jgi:FtsP/CotA-like multicopper oxidase with cupredoxin domain